MLRPSRVTAPTLFAAIFLGCIVFSTAAYAQVPLTQISTDPFTNATSQHATEVEGDTYAVGSTIISVFQTGRFTDGGSSDIGYSTSKDGGTTWTHGFLPGLTKYQNGGKYDRASDPSVVYNAKYKLWLVETLPLLEAGGPHGAAVAVSSSVDGITWKNPVIVAKAASTGFFDKPWIGCDNTATSKYYGRCYVTWDDFSQFDLMEFSTSTNGGTTWGPVKTTAASDIANGGIPVVQPNGTVIVPSGNGFGSGIIATKSTDGGTTWGAAVAVANINSHGVSGGLRAPGLPAVQIDGAGKVYVAWADCSFRAGCASNDIVYSTSTNGTTWSAVKRVPIDAVASTADHFIPGLEVDRSTSGATTHMAVSYYFYTNTNCSTCLLGVGYVASTNGGTTWSKAKTLSTGTNTNWLPSTTAGQMVGDYASAVTSNGKIHGVFATAKAPVGSKLNEAMETNATGLADLAEDGLEYTSIHDRPVPNAHSDHPRSLVPMLGQ